ncbi:hypothetical protein LIER_13338 [Lithospermum erythrorhizon]|uniref:Uncharacterized protein n=1 Tax=Lithospermum erythrorhizon TaxID=34254 RepID=A0AAV3PX90_LITER
MHLWVDYHQKSQKENAWLEPHTEDAIMKSIRHQKFNCGTRVHLQAAITHLDQKRWPTTTLPRQVKNTPGVQFTPPLASLPSRASQGGKKPLYRGGCTAKMVSSSSS